MIKDFSNPHGEIIPDRTEKIPSLKKEFKIEREHGLFRVYEKAGGVYIHCTVLVPNGHYLPAIFQTIHEAENCIRQIASSTIINYYTL
jgi:hypothetical protein